MYTNCKWCVYHYLNCFCWLNPSIHWRTTGLWSWTWVCALTVICFDQPLATPFPLINVTLFSFKVAPQHKPSRVYLFYATYSICVCNKFMWMSLLGDRVAASVRTLQVSINILYLIFLLFLCLLSFFIFPFYYQICESPLSVSVSASLWGPSEGQLVADSSWEP